MASIACPSATAPGPHPNRSAVTTGSSASVAPNPRPSSSAVGRSVLSVAQAAHSRPRLVRPMDRGGHQVRRSPLQWRRRSGSSPLARRPREGRV